MKMKDLQTVTESLRLWRVGERLGDDMVDEPQGGSKNSFHFYSKVLIGNGLDCIQYNLICQPKELYWLNKWYKERHVI